MKWLYRIIARILPCRHKWVETGETMPISLHTENYGLVFQGQRIKVKCKKCGKLDSFYWGAVN